MLTAFTSASTLFFPFGDVYKLSVRRPFLCFSCVDFEDEVRKLEGPKANTLVPASYEHEEVRVVRSRLLGASQVALDITDEAHFRHL